MGLEDLETLPGRRESNLLTEIVPDLHREYLSSPEAPTLDELANAVYEHEIANAPGLKAEWEKLGNKEAGFQEAYSRYVSDGLNFRVQAPDQYDFLRDRVFFGQEYPDSENLTGENYLNEDIQAAQPADTVYGKTSQERYDVSDSYVEEAVEVVTDCPNIRSYVWEGLTPSERLEVLSDFTKKIAEVLKAPVKDIKFENIPANTRGYYNEDGYIHLNSDVLTDPAKLKDAMDTVLHETRHAFQRVACKDPLAYGIDESTAIAWRNNITHYISPEMDFEGYIKQPIESDARDFAATVLNAAKI